MENMEIGTTSKNWKRLGFSRLFLRAREESTHGDITHWDPKSDGLDRVKRMFNGFAEDPHPGMKEKMAEGV